MNILFFLFLTYFSAEKIQLQTKVSKETQENSLSSFTPLDNSFRFKINPKELKDIKEADIQSIINEIDGIKSQIFDYKSKIVESKRSLKGIIDIPLANLQINYDNDMSSRYKVVNISCLLDGKIIYSNYDLKNQEVTKVDLYNSMIAPGFHDVVVQVVYVGNADGVFDYLNNYRVKIRSRHSFNVDDGVSYVLTSQGYEKGSIFTSFKDKPDIKFISKIENYAIAPKDGGK